MYKHMSSIPVGMCYKISFLYFFVELKLLQICFPKIDRSSQVDKKNFKITPFATNIHSKFRIARAGQSVGKINSYFSASLIHQY